jgi:sulfate/thiosulfate transport system ATP-binding protein
MLIEIRKVSKAFGEFTALNAVDLTLHSGELVALLGPSGSGKTTLLRIIAGLDFPDTGRVLFDGEDALELSVRERKVGFVFQHYSLFRHMNVYENIAFGLRVKPPRERLPRSDIRERVMELLHLVQMEGLAERYPSQLSGGQRQRVALARTLAIEPRFLLLDEPFGALDAHVRRELRKWLRKLQRELRLTSAFVTHDQEEALELADRVVIMNAGRVEQTGTAQEVYDHPTTPFVYQFLGNANALPCRLRQGIAEIGPLRWRIPEHTGLADGPAIAYIRPHNIDIDHPDQRGDGVMVIREVVFGGPIIEVELFQPGTETVMDAQIPRSRWQLLGLKAGDEVAVRLQRVKVFPYLLNGGTLPSPFREN